MLLSVGSLTDGQGTFISEIIKKILYLGSGNFTRKVFCSTLEGHFVEASQYVNGHFVNLGLIIQELTNRILFHKHLKNISNKYYYENKIFIDYCQFFNIRISTKV